MKTSNDLKKLLHQVARNDGFGRSGLLMPVKAANAAASTSSSKSLSIGSPQGVRSLALNEPAAARNINFGSPSSSGASRSTGGAEWANLLKQTASGGISGMVGGGILSAVGGLGGLVSSFAKLFGGGAKTEAPLIRFQLPDSQNETVFASSHQTGGAASQSIHDQLPQWQSTQITEAVKQALLNSSSLNDVIAEI